MEYQAYRTMEHLPDCTCGCGQKKHINLDHLAQYSTDLLETMLREIQRITEPYSGIFGCSAPTCDEDAWNAWYAEKEQVFAQFSEPVAKITAELKKRTCPKSLEELVYSLVKLFENMEK